MSDVPLLLHPHLDLPTDVSTDAFIVRVGADRREDLARYVLPEAVYRQLDALLKVVGERLAQGKDIGRFLHGSFGSGKSHLMQVLAAMLRRDPVVYEVGDPRLRLLRQAHPWLDQRRVLTVSLNMMDRESSLTEALYRAYNAALPAGTPPAVLSDHERALSLMDRDADLLGGMDRLVERLVADGVVPGRPWLERARQGDLQTRQQLAAAFLNWRNAGQSDLVGSDLWLGAREGFEALSRHARDQGFDTVAFFIDELIIWIRGKVAADYAHEINHLSALVDHDGQQSRAVPFFVAVAVQRDIADTQPEDMSEAGFREYLRFIANRFEPPVMLEDTDLYEVCERRILRRRDDQARAALDGALDAVLAQHQETLQTLAQGVTTAQVRALYPFHPALIRVLMDVTQAFSRSRTGVQVLYALLVEYLPELQVGQWVPLGTLFDAIFTTANRTALANHVRSPTSQKLAAAADAYDRLRGVIKDLCGTTETCPYDPARLGCAGCLRQHPDREHQQCFQYNQLVKTVLLCQESPKPFFEGKRSLAESITIRNLQRLNRADIRAAEEEIGDSRVRRLFDRLSAASDQVTLVGDGPDAVVHIDTESVNVAEVLDIARGKVRHADRFKLIRGLLDEELGLRLGTGTEVRHALLWRGTKRKGKVRLCNVRTLPYAGARNDFDPGADEFLVLVDYPFDEEPGKGRDDDVDLAGRARSRKQQWAACWLPEHLEEPERRALDTAAAIELVRDDPGPYLESRFKVGEIPRALQKLDAFQESQKSALRRAIRRAYFERGIVVALHDGIELDLSRADAHDALAQLAQRILDVRYPQHPRFPREVRAADLALVLDWVTESALTRAPVEVPAAQRHLVGAIAEPLQLVHPGTTSIRAREDGHYLRRVLDWARPKRHFKASELRGWLMDEGRDGFGLVAEVADAFVFYLLQVEGYEAVGQGEQSLTVDRLDAVGGKDFVLRKDEVVDAPTWDAAREAARVLFGLTGRRDLPSSPEQSKLSRAVLDLARSAVAQLEELERDIRTLLGWLGGQESQAARLATLDRARSVLGGLVDAPTHHDRVARLAASVASEASSASPGLVTAVTTARPERQAAASLRGKHNEVETVLLHGTPDEQAPLRELKTLLHDDVQVSLAAADVRLRSQLDQAFREIMRRLRPVPPGPLPPGPLPPGPLPPGPLPPGPGAATRSVGAVARASVVDAARSLAEQALAGLEGGAFEVTLTLQRKDPTP